MSLLFWGLTVGTIGKIVLGIAVLRVHMHILHEHRIDNVVLTSIKRERYVTAFAIFLIALGYAFEILFYGYTPLLSCEFGQCGAAINTALESAR